MEERMKIYSLYLEILDNAVDYVYGEANYDEFISAHQFYYSWFIGYDFEKHNTLDFIFATRLNYIVYESMKHAANKSQSKEELRCHISQLLETIESISH